MTYSSSKQQLCINLSIALGILYFVLYRVLQQRQWDGVLMKHTRGGTVSEEIFSNPQVPGSLSFVYTPPEQSGIRDPGRPFLVNSSVLEHMGLPPKQFFQLTNETVKNFIFVTAVDTSHFAEVKDCIASIQKYFPKYNIILYDLGMEQAEIKEASHWCNVKYRKFDAKPYPKHVKRITHKAFKFLVIQEVLSEYGAVFWVDASFRAVDPVDSWQEVFDLALRNGGIVMVYNETGEKPLTNYAWSDPYMFQFLPTDLEIQKALIQQCSCAVLIYNTEFVYHNVLWWMYLCSLERECITRASGTASVDWQNLELEQLRSTFIVHRYDQSALNTILGNLFGYDQSKYTTVENHNVIRRLPTDMYKVKECG